MKHLQELISNRGWRRTTAMLIAALSCLPAMANADEPAYTMTTIEDAAHGAEIASGNYEQAIDGIAESDERANEFYRNTNLCVAYTKTGNIEDAARACDAAVDQADSVPFDRRDYMPRSFQERTRKRYLALALSNRGVLHAVTGNVDLARQDFVEALRVRSLEKVVKNNLARLGNAEAKKA